MSRIRYRQLRDGDTWQATDGDDTVDVRRCWYRVGGWQWECPEVLDGRVSLRRPTRKACADAALAKLRRMRAAGEVR